MQKTALARKSFTRSDNKQFVRAGEIMTGDGAYLMDLWRVGLVYEPDAVPEPEPPAPVPSPAAGGKLSASPAAQAQPEPTPEPQRRGRKKKATAQ